MCSLCIPEMVAKVMVNRGIIDPDEADHFLDAKLKNLMPDPSEFIDMDSGVERITTAILENQKISVFGDYDVDGVTSTCLLVQYLRDIGIDPEYCIPNRFSDGYGLNFNIFQRAADNGANLFVVVDSGIGAINEIDFGNKLGLDTIVIDHHMPLEKLPDAVAVINPNRKDQNDLGKSRIQNMSAAGVVFMLLVALQRNLKKQGFFSLKKEPDLKNMLGIVALGTICDVMDLRGINRAFVNFAIKNQTFSAGIKALNKASGIEKISSSDDFAFSIGPAINAAGRLGDAVSAIEMMLATEQLEAERFADRLMTLNTKRKELEKHVFNEAVDFINLKKLHENKAIFVYGHGWHEGVIGIIASRLKEKFGKPAFVVSFDGNGNGKGSARSVPGLSVFETLTEARKRGIITKGGGHELAGGFSLSLSSSEMFSEFLNETVITNPRNTFDIDFVIPGAISLNKLADEISILEPFGKGAERPIFCIKRVQIDSTKQTQDGNHMMMFVSCSLGETIRCMLFNIKTKTNLVNFLKRAENTMVDLAFTIKNNKKYGASAIIEDVRYSNI